MTAATDAGAKGPSLVTLVKEDWKVSTDIAKGDWGSTIGDMTTFLYDAQSQITDAASDPVGYLIGQGLGFLEHIFSPLNDMINQITGNPDAADAAAEDWREISTDMAKLSQEIADLTGSFHSWQGSGHDAAVAQLQKFSLALNGISGEVAQLANALQISGAIMDAAKEVVNSILSTLIEWAVFTFIAAQAAAPVTFGASEGVAAAAIEGEAAVNIERGSRVVSKLESLIIRVKKLLPKLQEALTDSLKKAGEGVAVKADVISINGSPAASQSNSQIDSELGHNSTALPDNSDSTGADSNGGG